MKHTSDTRKPYLGHTRSLVIALDVGTTFSGVSYAILEPGEVPKIHGVTRFPGQEHVAGNSKIPTILYYDRHGAMVVAGAEADSASIEAQAEEEGWTKAELFKLRLRPKSMKLEMNGMRLGRAPHGKTSVDLFSDFLGYLFRCTRMFIVDTHANGSALWNAVEKDIEFVLSHPNGWEGSQQSKMRRAAIQAGLIPDTDEGRARVRFVTEGEASLHACVLNGLAADVLSNPSGHGFLVADAGGGTLDISSYAIRGVSPLVIEEIAPPDCIFSGSVFVSRRARAFFEEKLKKSTYGTPPSLDHITKRFDETTKRLFRDKKDLQFVHFGSPFDKDPDVGIRSGQLKLTGDEVASLFEPSIEAAMSSIISQIQQTKGIIKSVWLVGGFAASPWLFTQLQVRLEPLDVTVSRPDSQTSKAVADGAIGFYCDHHVSARMSKYVYGVEFLREFNPEDEEHVSRQHALFELPSGPKLLPDAFDCILARGIKVKESTTFSKKYCTELTSLSTLSVFEVEIWCYRGSEEIPKWIRRNREDFGTLCFVRADLSPLSGSAQPKIGTGGKTYWTIVFYIEIHFGLTEFKARMKWSDNGKVKYGPASIVYNESGTKAEDDFDPDNFVDDLSASLQQSKGPSRTASAAGTPKTRSPVARSVTITSPTAPVSPLAEEHTTSRSISWHTHVSVIDSVVPPTPVQEMVSQPQAGLSSIHASPTSRSIPELVISTSPKPSSSPAERSKAPTPLKATSSQNTPRSTPSHSRATSIPRGIVAPSSVAFPTVPTPPAVPSVNGSRNPSVSPKERSHSVEVGTPVPADLQRISPLATSMPLATPPAVESRKTSPTLRSNTTPPVSSPLAAPPTINLEEPPKAKSRSISITPASPSSKPLPSTLVDKGKGKSKSKSNSASNSAAPTNAVSTPLIRSTKSSMNSQIGEMLNGVWGAPKSTTASPWKDNTPLDPPPTAVAELRRELMIGSSSPPIVGNSQQPLETIMEPEPAGTRQEDLTTLEQPAEVPSEESQEPPAPPQEPVAEQQPPALEPDSVPEIIPESVPKPEFIPKDLPLEIGPVSNIPGGFGEGDLLGDIATQSEEPVAPASAKNKKSKKKKTDSKDNSFVPTPIQAKSASPLGSPNNGDHKIADVVEANSQDQPALVLPVVVDPQSQIVDQLVDQELEKQLEEKKEDMVTQVLNIGKKESKLASDTSGGGWGSWGKSLINSATTELLGGASKGGTPKPGIPDMTQAGQNASPKLQESKTPPEDQPVRQSMAWGASGKTTPAETAKTAWATGNGIFGSLGAGLLESINNPVSSWDADTNNPGAEKTTPSLTATSLFATSNNATDALAADNNHNRDIPTLGSFDNDLFSHKNNEKELETSADPPSGEATDDTKPMTEPATEQPENAIEAEPPKVEENQEVAEDFGAWGAFSKSGKGSKKSSKVATPAEPTTVGLAAEGWGTKSGKSSKKSSKAGTPSEGLEYATTEEAGGDRGDFWAKSGTSSKRASKVGTPAEPATVEPATAEEAPAENSGTAEANDQAKNEEGTEGQVEDIAAAETKAEDVEKAEDVVVEETPAVELKAEGEEEDEWATEKKKKKGSKGRTNTQNEGEVGNNGKKGGGKKGKKK